MALPGYVRGTAPSDRWPISRQEAILATTRLTHLLRLVVYPMIYVGVLYMFEVVTGEGVLNPNCRSTQRTRRWPQVQRWPWEFWVLHHAVYLKFCLADRDRDYFQFCQMGDGRQEKLRGLSIPNGFFSVKIVHHEMIWDGFSQEIRWKMESLKPGNRFWNRSLRIDNRDGWKGGNASYSWAVLGRIYIRWKGFQIRIGVTP